MLEELSVFVENQRMGRLLCQKIPSPAQILGIIRQYSTNRATDEQRFIDSLILSWLIGGTDAHAKNFSILIASGAQVRLAPLYDLSSALPYPKQVDLRRAALALKIGGAYKLREIGPRQWEKFAAEHRLKATELIARILHLAERIPDSAHAVANSLVEERLTHPVINRLVEEISSRAIHCRQQFRI
jgi:serine/threonine-protein kinase HipA